MAFIVHSIGKKNVEVEPDEIHDEWEDVIDNYGEPEAFVPGLVWVVKSERDKEWHGCKAGDPVLLIYKVKD